MTIHPSAIIDSSAVLADGITVHPFSVIEAGVEIGEGCEILAGSIIQSGTRIGKNCRIGPYASLGNIPMDRKFSGEHSSLNIGDNCIIYDFASIHRASGEGNITVIGSDVMLMAYGHVSHNAVLNDGCTVASGTQIWGHVHIGSKAFVGGNTAVHQGCHIGELAMVGASCKVTRDVLPYLMVDGHPAQHYRINKVGLERNGFKAEIADVEDALVAYSNKELDRLELLSNSSQAVKTMQAFTKNSKRGISGFR